jgi:hypothetical protein
MIRPLGGAGYSPFFREYKDKVLEKANSIGEV